MQEENQSNLSTIVVVAAVIAFALGYLAGGGFTAPESAQDNKGFEEGWQAAKQRLKETGYAFEQEKVSKVNGRVKKVGDNELEVKINPLTPLMKPELEIRTLKITDETKIYKEVEKSREQFEQEREEFEQQMQKLEDGESAPEEAPEAPRPYELEEISFSEIEKGQYIEATSLNEQNIKEDKSFEVSEVVING